MKTHLKMLAEPAAPDSFVHHQARADAHRSGVIARVTLEEEPPPSTVDRDCDAIGCEHCDAFRDRMCARLYSQPPPPGNAPPTALAALDFEDVLPFEATGEEHAPRGLRSEELRLELVLDLDLELAPDVAPPDARDRPRHMHYATCAGELCHSCGAYAERLCSLLYGV